MKYSCSTNATISIQEGSEQSKHLDVFCVRRVEREGEGKEETRGKGGEEERRVKREGWSIVMDVLFSVPYDARLLLVHTRSGNQGASLSKR